MRAPALTTVALSSGGFAVAAGPSGLPSRPISAAPVALTPACASAFGSATQVWWSASALPTTSSCQVHVRSPLAGFAGTDEAAPPPHAARPRIHTSFMFIGAGSYGRSQGHDTNPSGFSYAFVRSSSHAAR